MNSTITHRVIRPSAGIVSKHRGLRAAVDSIIAERRGAHRQGGECHDVIEARSDDGWAEMNFDGIDPDVFRCEAVDAGDWAAVDICDRADEGDLFAMYRIIEMVRDAQAMDD